VSSTVARAVAADLVALAVAPSSEPRPWLSSAVGKADVASSDSRTWLSSAVGEADVASSDSRPRSSLAVTEAVGEVVASDSWSLSSALGTTDAPAGIDAGMLWLNMVLPATPRMAGTVATAAARMKRIAFFMTAPWRWSVISPLVLPVLQT
jgi:hypothetical protein